MSVSNKPTPFCPETQRKLQAPSGLKLRFCHRDSLPGLCPVYPQRPSLAGLGASPGHTPLGKLPLGSDRITTK